MDHILCLILAVKFLKFLYWKLTFEELHAIKLKKRTVSCIGLIFQSLIWRKCVFHKHCAIIVTKHYYTANITIISKKYLLLKVRYTCNMVQHGNNMKNSVSYIITCCSYIKICIFNFKLGHCILVLHNVSKTLKLGKLKFWVTNIK